MYNLIYSVGMSFVNNSGVTVSVRRTMDDTGLEVNYIQIGDTSVVEETVNGRVLSGSFKSDELECGYRYNYELDNEDYLVCTNSDVSLNKTVDLINKTKMKQEFMQGMLMFSVIVRRDYKTIFLNNPNITVSRLVMGMDDELNTYEYKEDLVISKEEQNVVFHQIDKKVTCIRNDEEESLDDSKKFNDLSFIVEQNPRTYRELLDLLKKGENPTKTITI